MFFSPAQIAALSAPLAPSAVKSRNQAGRSLSYVEGWHAIAEANRIFGFDGWDRETIEIALLGEPRLVEGKSRVGYRAKVRVVVRTESGPIIRDGCGFGSGIDRDVDQAHESALKEAETDAMKRALMTFGNPFGLALYDKEQRNVGEPTLASTRNPNPVRDVVEYVEKSKAAVAAFAYSSEIVGWWRSETGRRNELGITKDTAAYAEIVALCEARREALEGERSAA